MSRSDASAYPLTPGFDVAAIKRADTEFYGTREPWEAEGDESNVRDFPSRPSDVDLIPQWEVDREWMEQWDREERKERQARHEAAEANRRWRARRESA